MDSLTRLQKFIADCGVCSRRAAEQLITDGRVTVNGKITTRLGSKVDIRIDAVKLDGKRLHLKNHNQSIVYALNKPKGCVSTLFDPEGRPTIADYIPKSAPRIFPIGRLDYDSDGLVLLTNDGDLANLIMHPRYEIWKHYLIKTKGELKEADIDNITNGFKLRGKITAPAKIKVIKSQDDKFWYEIILREGRNHQIKETILDFGLKLLKIKRIRIANIELGDLKKGECRRLKDSEVEALKKFLEDKKSRLKKFAVS